jgi:hypothetical protein
MSRPRPSATDRIVVAAVAGSLALVSGCGPGATEIPAGAVAEVSGVAGGTAHDALPLAAADVSRLAGLAGVEPDVLETVASSLDESEVWASALTGVRTIYDDAPDGVESTLVEIACQALDGRIHTDVQLHFAIFQRVNGFATSGVDRLTATAYGLFGVLYDAVGSGRAEHRAAAVLACHAFEQLEVANVNGG